MGTSVTSTGITFPDATSQTTAATSAFAAGTVVLFFQAAAPTGWTKATTYDDYDLRLTTGVGGGSVGGTTAYSTVFANQTPTITLSGLSAGATTLSTAQMPSHSHTVTQYAVAYGGPNQGNQDVGVASFFSANPITNAQGSGGSHTHTVSGSGSSSAITLNVRYANIIACSKN